MHLPEAAGVPRILVAVSEACVYVDGNRHSLTPRETDVLMALAVSRRPLSTDTLVERVWPEQDPERTRLSLKVYVYRLRRRLGSAAAIAYNQLLWSLGAGVRVDIDEWQRLARPESQPLTAQSLAELRLAYEKLSAGTSDLYLRSALFEHIDELLRQVLFRVATRLMEDARRRQSLGSAISIAHEMSQVDGDDSAWNNKLSELQGDNIPDVHSLMSLASR